MQFLKMELACLGVMVYLTLFYLQTKRPPTTSYIACKTMLFSGTSTIFLESIAVYLVSAGFDVPVWLTRIAHQLFFISLCAFLFFACYYLLSIVESKNLIHFNIQIGMAVPFLCAVILMLAMPIYFQQSAPIAYCYGPATYTYTLCALLYMGTALVFLMRYRDVVNPQKREPLMLVAAIVIALALLQMLAPSLMISGICVILLSLAVVLSMESPAEFLSTDGMLFNRKAFAAVVDDSILREKPITTVFIIYRQMATMEESFGKDCVNELIFQLEQYIRTVFSLDMYMPIDGCAAIMVNDPKRAETIVFGLQQRFENEWTVLGVPLNIYADICSYQIPDPYASVDDVIAAAIAQSETEEVAKVDIDKKLGIKNRNAFERALLILHQNRKTYSSIYYLLADIKGLHSINEEFGYISGDKILKDCADVLSRAAGETAEVYRVGGDEFAILLVSKTDNEMRDLLERIQTEREKCNKERGKPQLEISVGYSRYYENSDRSFNSMMARAEYQMTNQKHHMAQEVDLYNTTHLGTKLPKL